MKQIYIPVGGGIYTRYRPDIHTQIQTGNINTKKKQLYTTLCYIYIHYKKDETAILISGLTLLGLIFSLWSHSKTMRKVTKFISNSQSLDWLLRMTSPSLGFGLGCFSKSKIVVVT